MGFNPFKSTKKITVSTTVSRVIEDKFIPNSVKNGLVKGIFANDDQLVEHVIDEMSQSIGVRAERMYRYGKRKYIHGLPASTILTDNTGKDRVEAVLEEIEGRPVKIDYFHYGSLNHLHYGWKYIVETYGYSALNNELCVLSAQKGFPVFMQDLQVVVTDATIEELNNTSLEQWGTAAAAGYSPSRPIQSYGRVEKLPTPYIIDANASSDYFSLSFTWTEVTTTVVAGAAVATQKLCAESLTFPMTSDDPGRGYFQVKYSYGNSIDAPKVAANPSLASYLLGSINLVTEQVPNDTVTKYWTYDDGLGTYPSLDTIYAPELDEGGQYFPFGYFRYNKVSTSTLPDTEEFKSSKRLMKYLSLDFEDLSESINTNPDIKDVESALLMMAIPADSEDPMDQRYLYDYFKNLYSKTGEARISKSGNSFLNKLGLGNDPETQISVVIQDKKFKMSLTMSGIFKKRIVGNFGKVGDYSAGFGKRTVTSEVERKISQPGNYGPNPVTTTIEIVTVVVPCHYFRKQITPTIYDEVQVYELNTNYFVWGSYVASSDEDEEKKNLLIPLDHSITTEYSSMDRELLYCRSLHYIFNSKIVTKVKWYQQGWFKIVMMVAAVVITVLSMGSAGPAMAATLATAFSSMAAFMAFILPMLVKYLVIKLITTLLVKLLGPEMAMLFAIVAACYGMLDGAINPTGVDGMPFATEMLQAASGLMNEVSSFFNDALVGLKEDADKFQLYAQEKTQLLEDTQNLLAGDNTLLTPFMFLGESWEDSCNRMVHNSNPGVLSIEAVGMSAEYLIQLPTVQQTMNYSFT